MPTEQLAALRGVADKMAVFNSVDGSSSRMGGIRAVLRRLTWIQNVIQSPDRSNAALAR